MNEELQQVYAQGYMDKCAERQINPDIDNILGALMSNPGSFHSVGDFGGPLPVYPKQAGEEEGEGQEKAASAPADTFEASYTQGFIDKCAEHGVDPEALTKQAFTTKELLAVLGILGVPGAAAGAATAGEGDRLKGALGGGLAGSALGALGFLGGASGGHSLARKLSRGAGRHNPQETREMMDGALGTLGATVGGLGGGLGGSLLGGAGAGYGLNSLVNREDS
jgi:hypothetical protein